MINTYDIDGVIFINNEFEGLTPTSKDIIITGRSFEEEKQTRRILSERGISNTVYFNKLKFDQKSRVTSGIHKGEVLNMLKEQGIDVGIHFEDDEIQIEEIKKIAPWVNVIHIKHELTEKENVWHE
jgi:hypothetical protein